MLTAELIHAARARIRPFIYHSPCPYSLSLSNLCGCHIYCKLDHLQMTGSFKERGARNTLMLLDPARRARGVVAASAGNHALALAYHGRAMATPVTVVMPRYAPIVKVANCRAFGANVVLHGETYDEARAQALAFAEAEGRAYVPGFDDLDVMAGAGTLGVEILEDVPGVEAVIVPVGGGGLISGVATAVKAARPGVKIIGVEPEHAPTLKRSLEAGQVTRVSTRPTLADGLAVAEVGRLCFEIVRPLLDDLMLVDEATIARSILHLLELEKTVVEGAGAVALAAAMQAATFGLAGRKVVLVLCGGNIDVTTLSRVIDRGLASSGRLCRLTVHLSERPGSLAAFLGIVAATGASVKDVAHDRHFGPEDIARVAVVITMETRDAAHVAEVHAALRGANIDFEIDD